MEATARLVLVLAYSLSLAVAALAPLAVVLASSGLLLVFLVALVVLGLAGLVLRGVGWVLMLLTPGRRVAGVVGVIALALYVLSVVALFVWGLQALARLVVGGVLVEALAVYAYNRGSPGRVALMVTIMAVAVLGVAPRHLLLPVLVLGLPILACSQAACLVALTSPCHSQHTVGLEGVAG